LVGRISIKTAINYKKENTMELEEVIGMMEAEAELRPIIKKGLELLKSYGPDLKDLMRGIVLGSVDLKMEAIARYEANGFTREEAMLLVMDEWFAIARNTKTINSGKK
jgi:hypothetical protein